MTEEEMIRGLVRAAEMIEQRDGAIGVWDDEVAAALLEARARGWGKHKIGVMEERTRRQIEEWMRLKDEAEGAHAIAEAADLAVDDFVETHCRSYPLTAKQQRELRTTLQTGHQLCCEAGREALAKIVDPIWVEVINGWAYENLTCRKAPVPRTKAEQLQRLDEQLKEWMSP